MPYLATTQNSRAAADYIAQGRIVAFPTRTSYGLAVDALQGHALQRLRNLKNRPQEKTFTVFMAETLWDTHLKLTADEREILKAGIDKPLTLLVTPSATLEHLAQNHTIGLRVIDHMLMGELAANSGVPLTATSANRSGEKPCYTEHCLQKTFTGRLPDHLLGEDIPAGAHDTTYDLSLACILGGESLTPTRPSTIAQIVNHQVKIHRAGALTEQELTTLLHI